MIDHRPDWSRLGGRVKARRHELTTEELATLGGRRSRLLDRMREAYGEPPTAQPPRSADAAGQGRTEPRPPALARCPAD